MMSWSVVRLWLSSCKRCHVNSEVAQRGFHGLAAVSYRTSVRSDRRTKLKVTASGERCCSSDHGGEVRVRFAPSPTGKLLHDKHQQHKHQHDCFIALDRYLVWGPFSHPRHCTAARPFFGTGFFALVCELLMLLFFWKNVQRVKSCNICDMDRSFQCTTPFVVIIFCWPCIKIVFCVCLRFFLFYNMCCSLLQASYTLEACVLLCTITSLPRSMEARLSWDWKTLIRAGWYQEQQNP